MMKNFYKYFAVITLLLFVSCESNPPDLGEYTGKELVYQLTPSVGYEIEGKVHFRELKNESLQVDVTLVNTIEGVTYPIKMHEGKADTTGQVILNLEAVDGTAKKSTMTFSKLINDATVSFDSINVINASVKVYPGNSASPATSTNIGINSLGNNNYNPIGGD